MVLCVPRHGRELGNALDGAMVEAGQYGGEIFARRDLQSAAASTTEKMAAIFSPA